MGLRIAKSLALTFGCFMAGYGFYSMNHHDTINACVFTLGLMGIMLSVLRKKKPLPAPEPLLEPSSGSSLTEIVESPSGDSLKTRSGDPI